MNTEEIAADDCAGDLLDKLDGNWLNQEVLS